MPDLILNIQSGIFGFTSKRKRQASQNSVALLLPPSEINKSHMTHLCSSELDFRLMWVSLFRLHVDGV